MALIIYTDLRVLNYVKENTMYKKLLWIAVLAASFVLSQATFADSMCGKRMSDMIESLKLDATQKDKIKPILDQLKINMKDSKNQMNDLDKQIAQLDQAPNIDQAAIDALIDKKALVIGTIMKNKSLAKNQIIAILTPKQKTELQDMMKKEEDKLVSTWKKCHGDD